MSGHSISQPIKIQQKPPKFLSIRIRKRYYKTLRTSDKNSPMSPPSLFKKLINIFFSGLTFGDIFFDSLLAVEYYHQYNNESYVQYSRVSIYLSLYLQSVYLS